MVHAMHLPAVFILYRVPVDIQHQRNGWVFRHGVLNYPPGGLIGVVEVRFVADGGVVNSLIPPSLQHRLHLLRHLDDAFLRILGTVNAGIRILIAL